MSTESQDPNAQHSQDDVATLYSWANLGGAKYKDFSASRREVRSQARQRMVEQVSHVAQREPLPTELETEAPAATTPEISSLDTYEKSFDEIPLRTSDAEPIIEYHNESQELPSAGPRLGFLETALQEVMVPAAATVLRQAAPLSERRPSRPGAPDLTIPPANSHMPDRSARWSALMGVFDPAREQRLSSAQAPKLAAPVVAVFSLAGGVGKSSLVATLGRILAARGERVLLVDATPYGTLPFYYGASELRPGTVRTFSGEGIEAPIQMLSLDAVLSGPQANAGWLADLLHQHGAGADRILIDMGTASRPLAQAVLELAPTVIVPVVPDMSSMVTLQAVNSFFQSHEPTAAPVQPYYLLNRFDAVAAMHDDIRTLLHEQFGERLMPLELRASNDVSEALAEGMTVADYAPESAVNEDYVAIAEWIRQQAAIRRRSRGVRWSEQ